MADYRLKSITDFDDKKMASRFDLLNALAPIVTNSPWFGTAKQYSMKLTRMTRGKLIESVLSIGYLSIEFASLLASCLQKGTSLAS
ncbi:MAG: hypothetical protein DUD34_00690 [Lactobacillus sp.]|nr:MAG: hypothetical protein DUD34_00690 [Lactobacillus sp.]